MFKNVKIIVLYQNFGGHRGRMVISMLKNRVGGIDSGVGEELKIPFNIIYIIGCLSLLFMCLIIG
jgi:hypothetical protein